MRALLRGSRQVKDIRLADLPLPQVGAGQVLARVAYAGICGSDLDILNDRNSIYRPPVVQGHEFSAVVEKVGSAVTRLHRGDKVVSETVFTECGICGPCRVGDYHLCQQKEALGWTQNGGFAELILLNGTHTHTLPDDADLQAAAMIEPSAIAAEGVCVKGRLRQGELVGVIGPGATGILSALIARAAGAGQVFLFGRNSAEPLRFPLARAAGIQNCINTVRSEPLPTVLAKTAGRELDLVIDTSGNIEGFQMALNLVKRDGRIVELGSITTEQGFPWAKAAWKAVDLSFVYSSSQRAWQEAIRLFPINSAVYRQLVTQVFPLEEFQAAFEAADQSEKSFKVLFQPGLNGENR